MLKKANRLSSNFEINVTRKYGAKASGQNFHLFYLKAKNYEGPSKFTVVVSNKFDKSAVRRNKVKRLFREAICQNLDRIKPGYWAVVHPKFNTLQKTYEEIHTDFTKTLQTLSFAQ